MSSATIPQEPPRTHTGIFSDAITAIGKFIAKVGSLVAGSIIYVASLIFLVIVVIILSLFVKNKSDSAIILNPANLEYQITGSAEPDPLNETFLDPVALPMPISESVSMTNINIASKFIPADSDMRNEYRNFLIFHRISNTMEHSAEAKKLNGKQKYELKNCLERWLLTNSNVSGNPFIHTNDTDNQLRTEITGKRLPIYFYDAFIKIAEQGLNDSGLKNVELPTTLSIELSARKETDTGRAEMEITGGDSAFDDNWATLHYGKFTFGMPLYRLRVLRHAAARNIRSSLETSDNKSHVDNIELARAVDKCILRCAMRYATVAPGGQQWAVPLSEYLRYIDTVPTSGDISGDTNGDISGNTNDWIECFTSPFNSQILRVNVLRGTNYKFCSLFFDTDEVFGSLGSFLKSDFKNKNLVVNPPYIDSLMVEAARKSVEAANNDCKIFFMGPLWSDSEFYEILSNYTREVTLPNGNVTVIKSMRQHLPKGHFAYEDLYNDKTIRTQFDSVHFEINVDAGSGDIQ